MTDQTPRTEATTPIESLRITNGSDPRETPRTEAGRRAYLAIPAHEDDAPRHVDDYEASWFIRGYEAAAQARTEAIRDIEAYAEGERAGIEIGRAEALDVEVLARAIERACADHNQDCWFRSSSRLGAEAILRAILAGETERRVGAVDRRMGPGDDLPNVHERRSQHRRKGDYKRRVLGG